MSNHRRGVLHRNKTILHQFQSEIACVPIHGQLEMHSSKQTLFTNSNLSFFQIIAALINSSILEKKIARPVNKVQKQTTKSPPYTEPKHTYTLQNQTTNPTHTWVLPNNQNNNTAIPINTLITRRMHTHQFEAARNLAKSARPSAAARGEASACRDEAINGAGVGRPTSLARPRGSAENRTTTTRGVSTPARKSSTRRWLSVESQRRGDFWSTRV